MQNDGISRIGQGRGFQTHNMLAVSPCFKERVLGTQCRKGLRGDMFWKGRLGAGLRVIESSQTTGILGVDARGVAQPHAQKMENSGLTGKTLGSCKETGQRVVALRRGRVVASPVALWGWGR